MIFKAIRILGAFALLGVGAVHLQQYYVADYSGVPTIGRLLKGRSGSAVVGAAALGGVTIAAGSLAALFISENGGLFGFIEPGYSLPVVLAIVTEAAALLLLAPVAMINLARASRGRARPPVAGGWPAALDGRQAR